VSVDVPDRDRIAIGELKPLDMPAHQSLRSDLAQLTDDELLAAVESPQQGDWLVVNARTGFLFDGNGRAYELLRRTRRPGSRISLSTTVPVEYYVPNYSMFPDMESPGS
jgi:hypothetical protein